MTDPIPPGMADRIVAYLMVDGASEAIEFYAKAFGATERYRMAMRRCRAPEDQFYGDRAAVVDDPWSSLRPG